MEITEQFAGLCCVYDDPRWISHMIESVCDNLGALYFLVSDRPWNGSPADNSETLARIRKACLVKRGIRLIEGSWANETDQRNAGLRLIAESGFQYCFIVDADEIYDPAQLLQMQTLAASRPDIGAWYMNWYTYWKTERFRIDPPETYTPSVFLRVGSARFKENRHVESATQAKIPPQVGVCHHLSYARSDEEILKKITTFSHSHEIRPEWFQQVWLAWNANPRLENLHPVYPQTYKRAVQVPIEQLPPVLRRQQQR